MGKQIKKNFNSGVECMTIISCEVNRSFAFRRNLQGPGSIIKLHVDITCIQALFSIHLVFVALDVYRYVGLRFWTGIFDSFGMESSKKNSNLISYFHSQMSQSILLMI